MDIHIAALSHNQKDADNSQAENESISLRDYLYYNDILYYGNDLEKLTQSFRMLDLTNGNPGHVTLDIFIEFFIQFMLCQGELMQTKFKLTKEMEREVEENFRQIAGNKQAFTLADFIKAKQNNPKLLNIVEDFS